MRTAFITSLVSALMSLIAILGLSAMTIVPHRGAELWQAQMMLISAVFFLIWIALAFCLRPRPSLPLLPRWLRGTLTGAGVVYVLGILLFVIG
ncbi:MAG TPA: hypothetical protein VH597_09485 [Verrucomicrobiae bacterium]|jgi:hypothetical protein|nr:hypothetical protein [Verrucomicrobiae bacterium]